MSTWVDRGGTFTDVITWVPGGLPTARKVRSDRAVVGDLAQGPLVFGTTVATNALLERRGVRTLLITTEGFADLPWLRHMARPGLFHPDQAWPTPLVHAVVALPGRIDAGGHVLAALDLSPLHPIDLNAYEAFAIALLHAPRHPEHERAVAAFLQARHPSAHISVGHELCPEVGFLARMETTVLDAAITPILQQAMTADRIPRHGRAIQSDGGLVPAHELRAPDAVLSGPAGGVLAVQAIARAVGAPGAVGLDMGGTSTDVCCVGADTLPRHATDVLVAGVSVRRPMLEVDTIAAGGGSVLWHDGIRLRVGPQSAGADPGPQCYGQGGPPTLTDAALQLGLVDASAFSPALDLDAVCVPGDAAAFVDVAREQMAAAIRQLAARRGVDVQALPLVAYGGAAGQHAADVADKLGMNTVLIHPFAAVLSAWGQTFAADTQRTVDAVWEPLHDVWSKLCDLVDTRRAQMPSDHALTVSVELRPAGTDHPIPVPWNDDQDALVEAFHRAHHAVFGFSRPNAVLEVVNLRLRAERAPDPLPAPHADAFGLGDAVCEGPRRLDCPITSVWVPEGWTASMADGLLRLSRTGSAATATPTHRTAHGVSVWGSRFMAVAEQAGEHLVRLARSVNIRERRDFSCAVFDGAGHLIANAPHIPVHLGAMGETVRDLLAHQPHLPHGSAWLTNAPDAGGSHLPDLTVVTPVVLGQHRFFVACRGHHVDVGGATPGSMPPHSTQLSQEGVVFRRLCLLDDTGWTDLAPHLHGCRQPDVVAADLQAQVAANRLAAQRLTELGAPEVIAAWMAHLQDAAEQATRHALAAVAPGEARDELDGVPLRVRCHHASGQLVLDWTGTGGPHAGNLNAPSAVVRAAALYALRLLVDIDIPLNEGALRGIDIVLPSPSILSPPADAAVVGGNVETSQRLVDLLLAAWNLRAASQGTMNNLTLGGEGWSLYETLGGGQGASADHAGIDGLQVHMTNTRATDPEVLETRLPVSVHRMSLRTDSGGEGTHRGGHGLVRELEVHADATVALLAARRPSGAPGLHGGRAGSPARDALRIDGVWHDWDGQSTQLKPGDRVRICTPGGGGWGGPNN